MLAALGYDIVCEGPLFVGFGTEAGKDKFALKSAEELGCLGPQGHIAFAAPSRAAVDRFHEAAMAHGATDNGAPGLREHYGPSYYACFIIDFDGHRLEAVINEATDGGAQALE